MASTASSVYLTGSVSEPFEVMLQNAEPDWRTLAMTTFQRYGLKVLNPLDLSIAEAVSFNSGMEQRVARSLQLIDQCDAVLANLTRPNYGSAMEIFYAYRRGKMVTVIGQKPFSPWILSHSQARFVDVENAIEYIIEESPRIDPVSWSMQYEALLAEQYEQFPPAGEPDYQFIGGDLPIMVMAPHSTAHFLDGDFQEPAAYTGSLAAVLNRTSRCHTLVSSFCCAADPFWHLETPMRRAFTDIVTQGEIGAVVFLLGTARRESPGLKVSGFGSDEETVEKLTSRLRLALAPLEPVAQISGETELSPLIRYTAHELNVPTMVLKVHKRYRMPRLEPARYSRLVARLTDFITEAGVEMLRARN